MKKIIILFFILFSKVLFAQTPTKAVVKTRILFVMDASGSMTNTWGETNRFRASKIILSSMLDSLQKVPNLEIGLRVFGSMSPLNANRFITCAWYYFSPIEQHTIYRRCLICTEMHLTVT